MEEYRSWGINAVKMKVGGVSLREDAARVKAVREVIGEDAKLMIYANCAYRFFEAVEFAQYKYLPSVVMGPDMPSSASPNGVRDVLPFTRYTSRL